MDITKKYWEDRAKLYKSDVRGVLFKKPYPAIINTWFHSWSLDQVKILVKKNKKLTILDIACGWGRLSAPLLESYPKISMRGIDLSSPYVKLYNKLLFPRGKAFTGTMEKMPLKTASVNGAFLVVSLMYLPTLKRQQKALSEIFRVLKNDGKFVLIERTPLMALLDLKKREHKQISFTTQAINDLINSRRGKIKKINSWPSSILPLYKSYIIEKHPLKK